jgi:hypothetical protein
LWPAAAAEYAMPDPIVPAPTTTIFILIQAISQSVRS